MVVVEAKEKKIWIVSGVFGCREEVRNDCGLLFQGLLFLRMSCGNGRLEVQHPSIKVVKQTRKVLKVKTSYSIQYYPHPPKYFHFNVQTFV